MAEDKSNERKPAVSAPGRKAAGGSAPAGKKPPGKPVDRETDALLREVDEELRREQIAKLWERYGTYALGAAFAVIVLVGGWRWWQAHQITLAEAAGAKYNSAMQLFAEGKSGEAETKLEELAASGNAGYAALARLQQAGALIKADRPKDSLEIFEAIAKDTAADPSIREFSTVQAASLRLGDADFTEMQNRLNDLAREGSAWRHSAREILGLAAIKAGKTDDARAYLGMLLGDKDTPQGTLERARVLMATIASAELSRPATAAEPAATGTSAAPAAAPAATGGDSKSK
jgi:hypothetical protein